MRRRQPIAVTVLLAAALPAAASAEETMRTAATSGAAGAVVAAPQANDALSVNPGALALAERYDATAHFGFGAQGTELLATVVDSRTLPLAVGLAYRRATRVGDVPPELLPGWIPADVDRPDDRLRQHHVALGLALPAAERVVSFGIGGDLTIERTEGGANRVAGNATAGVGVSPREGVSFGVAAQRVMPWWTTADRPFALVGGLEMGTAETGMLSVEVEGRWVEADPMQTRLGLTRAFGPVTARAGWRWTQAGARQAITTGFSLDGAGGGLDIGTELPVTTSIDGPQGWTLRIGAHLRGEPQR